MVGASTAAVSLGKMSSERREEWSSDGDVGRDGRGGVVLNQCSVGCDYFESLPVATAVSASGIINGTTNSFTRGEEIFGPYDS
jgi:hypothetical protein